MMAGGMTNGADCGIVCVGASAGGLAALEVLLAALNDDFALPLVIVQHRGRTAGDGLCEYLQKYSRRPLDEPEDKEEIAPGRVYLAPRDYHLLIERDGFALSTGALINFARPSIDALFDSAADCYGAGVVGVVLTGANHDGARGLARIKERGGRAVVQEPASAASPAMPAAALAAIATGGGGGVDHVLPLSEIAPLLSQLARCCSKGSSYGN